MSNGTGTSRRQQLLSLVAAGHASAEGGTAIRKLEPEVDKPATILKVLDENEHVVYTRLAGAYADDPVNAFVPAFHGIVEERDEMGGPYRFIRIDNLLHRFTNPKVMDVKIGTRTFLEGECQNGKLRPDLFKKILALYPEELTDADRAHEAVTKYRFMSMRDANSTISSLGYRVDGIAGYKAKSRQEVVSELSKFRTADDTCSAFHAFVEVSSTDDGQIDGWVDPLVIAKAILHDLKKLSLAAQESLFVRQHEFIGSSILIVADATGEVGVFWIDFAKTRLMADGCELSHRIPWQMGNHEDGVQLGLDNLVRAWSSVVKEFGGGSFADRRKSSWASDSMLGVSPGSSPKSNNCSDLAVLSLLGPFNGVVAGRGPAIYEDRPSFEADGLAGGADAAVEAWDWRSQGESLPMSDVPTGTE